MSDSIIKFLAYDGRINIVCAETSKLVEEARKIHDLSPTATAALGRMMTVTLIMASEMKSLENKITVQIRGNGPIGTIVAIANNEPKIKAYVTNPYVDIPLNEFGKLDVGGAVGNKGFINVIKDIGLKDPYIGMSELVTGEIGDDFANYFVKSEQRNSAVAVGVLVDKNGVKKSGGYIINAMPDVTEEDISNIEKSIFQAGAISKMLDNNLSLEEIARKVTGDENVKIIEDNRVPKFECDCSKDKMKKALISIGKNELNKIIEEDGNAELICHFCNKKYNFKKLELEKIIEENK